MMLCGPAINLSEVTLPKRDLACAYSPKDKCTSAQVHIAVQVLEPLMLPEELEQVFGSVAQLYSRSLADAFRRLPPQVLLASCTSICARCQCSCVAVNELGSLHRA